MKMEMWISRLTRNTFDGVRSLQFYFVMMDYNIQREAIRGNLASSAMHVLLSPAVSSLMFSLGGFLGLSHGLDQLWLF